MESKHKLKHRFDIVRKLGQGTYGKVQLAINKETGQEVAIKTIRKSKIENEQDAVRIRREIQIMSSIRHPNIVHIYEVFENKDKIVLVMQNASGGELYEYLSERKVLSDAEARRIFRQVVAAVYYIHKNKICHRDLKLENILLDEKGNAKIADFGLSNVYDEKGLLSTFCGSPLYASPEIVKGLPYLGPEVDCWSLGVLLYTLVYGAMPFDGSNFKKLVKQISNGDYYEPKQRAAASGLIRHLLTVKASERASIIDVCKNDWVNESYDTQLLQVAEDLANLSPVRLDLLIALQPQTTALQAEQQQQQQQQQAKSETGGFQMVPETPNEIPPTVSSQSPCGSPMQNPPPEQVVPCASLMRMPSLSVKSSASLGTVKSSSSATSVKSLHHFDGLESTVDPFGSLCDTANQGAVVRRTPSGVSVQSDFPSTSMASIELKSKDAEGISQLPKTSSQTGLQPVNPPLVCSDVPCRVVEERRGTNNLSDSSQDIHIVSRKTDHPKSRAHQESVEESLRSLVWPTDDAPPQAPTLKSTPGRLLPESGGPDDDDTSDMKGTVDVNENTVPRGLPMKSYKKFTFERNGGNVVVREKICQKEERAGNKKIVIEKRVTSRTSSFDASSTPVATESTTKTTRRDDSSDEEDFDIHFDSSNGPLGLLNVMKFMDADFRTRWQNHPIFQNLSRRPLGSMPSSVQGLQGHRRLHSPSLMKMFMDRDSPDDTRSLFDRRLPLGRDLQAFTTLLSDPVTKASDRKLSRGSSLDRSSFRATRMTSVPQPPPQSQVDPMSAAAYDGLVGSARSIPRYSRTVSDKTIGESQPPILRTPTQNSTPRPGVLHMELNFNARHPASFGLVHSWSNHGLWQQQQQQQGQSLQSTSSTPSRIEMRVHYSTPSSPPPTTPPIGMPPKPPKSDKEPKPGQTRNPLPPQEESVSDRINRRSYYHRFSSVDSQKRPTSTIWDQQSAGSMSAGAGALWEAASPDKPLGAPPRASSMTTTTTTKPSPSSSTQERTSSTSM